MRGVINKCVANIHVFRVRFCNLIRSLIAGSLRPTTEMVRAVTFHVTTA